MHGPKVQSDDQKKASDHQKTMRTSVRTASALAEVVEQSSVGLLGAGVEAGAGAGASRGPDGVCCVLVVSCDG